MTQKRSQNLGFTLIELIIVLVIAAIISLVGIVAIKSPSDSSLDLATKNISYILSFVREKATASSKPHKVYLTTPDKIRAGFGNFTLINNPDDNAPFDTQLSKKYPNITFFKNYSVRFDGIGRSTFVTVTSITVKSTTASKYIKINPSTGRVYVQ